MAVKRLAILFVAVLVGSTAPARAWCEATCLAPVASTTPHCPAHEPSSDTPAIASADSVDCPVVESARPVAAKLELRAPVLSVAAHLAHLRTPAPSHPRTFTPPDLRSFAPSHLFAPLRI